MIDISKKGYALISGGKYRISHAEGSAISRFVPSPVLKTIDWDSLKPTQQWLLEQFDKHWEIIAHWLVYLRTRAVDIKELPFILPEFLDLREQSELYSSQLDLCASVWEEVEIRHYYPTPHDWWTSCMTEVQQSQVDLIFASGGVDRVTPLKGQAEDGLRELLRDLKNGKVPFTESSKNEHLYRLYKSAIARSRESAKVRKDWKEYLNNLNLWIRAMKSNKQTKAIVHLGWRLYYQDANKMIPILNSRL